VTEQDLNDLLREHAFAHGVPGAAIGVLRDGVKTFAWHGIANARTGAPMTAASALARSDEERFRGTAGS
jgi:Beta-lactamase